MNVIRYSSVPSSCSSSARWRWPSTLYGLTFSATETKWVVSVAPRPAPETPDLASTTTSSIRSPSGASARIAAVG